MGEPAGTGVQGSTRRVVAMGKLWVLLGVAAALLFASSQMVVASQPPAKTFVAVMSADEEVPTCVPATHAALPVPGVRRRGAAAGAVGCRGVIAYPLCGLAARRTLV